MHEGAWSSRLGIPGRPAAAEDVIVARDLILAELTGARVHFLHVSTAGSVELVRAAKARGLAVTAEAAPHHFTLTDECCASFDPVFKVHPPLRTDADVAAIRRGLADGTIDAIATDHAPHTVERRSGRSRRHPPGCSASRRHSRSRSPSSSSPGPVARGRARAALVAPGRDRGLARPRADRQGRAGREPLCDRPARHLGGRPDAAREQGPEHALRGPQAHRPGAPHGLRGEPVVVDAEAQR